MRDAHLNKTANQQQVKNRKTKHRRIQKYSKTRNNLLAQVKATTTGERLFQGKNPKGKALERFNQIKVWWQW